MGGMRSEKEIRVMRDSMWKLANNAGDNEWEDVGSMATDFAYMLDWVLGEKGFFFEGFTPPPPLEEITKKWIEIGKKMGKIKNG